MNIEIIPTTTPLPVERAYAISMVIKSFKGRKNVEVHLFRPEYTEEDVKSFPWVDLIADPSMSGPVEDASGSARIVLESFTEAERDAIVEYLKERYADRMESLTAAPMDFPIPRGLTALSEVPEGKTFGVIRFEKVPHYNLSFPVHGLYDLAQHEPIIADSK